MLVRYIASQTLGAFVHAQRQTGTWIKAWVGESSDLQFCVLYLPSSHIVVINRSLDRNDGETLSQTMMSRKGSFGDTDSLQRVCFLMHVLQTTHHSGPCPNGV